VECEDQDTQQRDPKTHEMYLNVMRRFSQALLKVMPLCNQSILFLFSLLAALVFAVQMEIRPAF